MDDKVKLNDSLDGDVKCWTDRTGVDAVQGEVGGEEGEGDRVKMRVETWLGSRWNVLFHRQTLLSNYW